MTPERLAEITARCPTPTCQDDDHMVVRELLAYVDELEAERDGWRRAAQDFRAERDIWKGRARQFNKHALGPSYDTQEQP